MRSYKISSLKSFSYYLKRAFFAFAIFYLLFIIIRGYSSSLFFNQKDRFQVFIYGENSTFYSLASGNDVGSYVVSFYPNMKMDIPGGYGEYRIGAMGKFINLKGDSEAFSRFCSLATSTLCDFYFYEESPPIYFGQKSLTFFKKPSLTSILTMKSNASFFNRIYIAILFNNISKNDIVLLESSNFVKKNESDIIFDSKSFFKKYVGIFYMRSIRKENKNVQIIYTKNDKTAYKISSMLNGVGVYIADISENKVQNEKCQVSENSENFSYTSRIISDFFKCDLKKEKMDVYDIVFRLGSKIEKTWEL